MEYKISIDYDDYFANSNLSAWKIWYSLDNDVNRFKWAWEEQYAPFVGYSYDPSENLKSPKVIPQKHTQKIKSLLQLRKTAFLTLKKSREFTILPFSR